MNVLTKLFAVLILGSVLVCPNIREVSQISGGQDPDPQPKAICDRAINGFAACDANIAQSSSCASFSGASSYVAGSGFVHLNTIECTAQAELDLGNGAAPTGVNCGGGQVGIYSSDCDPPAGGGE